MDDETIAKINEVLRLSHTDLINMIDEEPLTWSGTSKQGPYQAELVCIWDDKKEKVVRLSCFMSYASRPWWKFFSDTTIYDVVLGPNDKRDFLDKNK